LEKDAACGEIREERYERVKSHGEGERKRKGLKKERGGVRKGKITI